MLQDLVFYDIEDLKGFIDPPDNHGIKRNNICNKKRREILFM